MPEKPLTFAPATRARFAAAEPSDRSAAFLVPVPEYTLLLSVPVLSLEGPDRGVGQDNVGVSSDVVVFARLSTVPLLRSWRTNGCYKDYEILGGVRLGTRFSCDPV